MPGEKQFRFGVNMVVPGSRTAWVEKCRKAEDLGFDVIGAADHLGMAPPFPALVLAAEATERVRLNTFVLNTPFYNPALLARDVTGTRGRPPASASITLSARSSSSTAATPTRSTNPSPHNAPGRRC